MNILDIINCLSEEKRKYEKSNKEEDKCRFYLLNQLFSTFFKYSTDTNSIDYLNFLYTINQIHLINPDKTLSEFFPEINFPTSGQLLFKIPSFKLSYARQKEPDDIIAVAILKLDEEIGKWSMNVDLADIENALFYKAWLDALDQQKKRNLSESEEMRLRNYVQKTSLSGEGKIAAYNYIMKCGDGYTQGLLTQYLKEQINNFNSWSGTTASNQWTYDEDKNIISKSYMGLFIPSKKSLLDKKNAAKHSGLVTQVLDDTPIPDIQVNGIVGLEYMNDIIQPKPNQIVISGRSASMMSYFKK